MASEPSRTASRPSAGVDERIRSTALSMLRSRGPAAVSIESVALASGVAKTTIYRRYENREELLRAVIASPTEGVTMPLDLSAYDTFRWLLGQAHETVDIIVGRGAAASILVDDDHEFTGLLLDMIRSRSDPLRQVLRASIASGELKSDLDVELVVSLFLGTFVAEMARNRVDRAGWADDVLSLLWPALSA